MGKRITQYELSHYRRKYEDQILVAACGCFDIFHIGHLEYLSGAKALGDLLLVGVNSDESIKQMKGTYPIFSIQDRMSMAVTAQYLCQGGRRGGKRFSGSPYNRKI